MSPAVHAQAAERGLKAIDATCPLVTKVHHEARRFAREGLQILLIGHAGHEEVEGTTGEAPEHITLVQSPGRRRPTLEVAEPGRVAWLSQTTLSVDETLETVGRLREKFPQLMDPPSDDICYATSNRQLAIKQIAARERPGDRRRLGQLLQHRPAGRRRPGVGRQGRPPRRQRGEVDPAWFEGVASVGVTSGASVPDDLVQGVLDLLVRARLPGGPGGAADRGVPRLRPARRSCAATCARAPSSD